MSTGWTGLEVDPYFERHYQGAGEVDLLRGPFHFVVPEGWDQAQFFANALAGRHGELGPYGDLEAAGLTSLMVHQFLGEADLALGEVCNVYSRKSLLEKWGLDQGWRDLWLAAWTGDPDIYPYIPEGWDTYDFYQWTCEGAVAGIEKRVCLDVYKGTAEELHETYKPDDGEEGEPMAIEIVDRNLQPIAGWTWESVCQDYGLSLTQADPPEGEPVFRLVRLIYDNTHETNFRMYALDENGVPLPGIAILMGIQPPSGVDLPADAAPRLTEDFWGQPEGRPNRALVLEPNELNFTNVDGYVQHSLGSGSNYIPPVMGGEGGGSHWAWVLYGDNHYYTDVPAGFGMWDNHLMFWPVFQLSVGEDGDDGDDGNGTDLSAVVEQLVRIGDSLEGIEATLSRIGAHFT